MPTKYSLSLYSIFTEHPFSSCIYSNSWKVKHVECTSCSQLKIWPNLSFNHFFTTKCRLSKVWSNFHQNNFRIFLSKVDDLYMVHMGGKWRQYNNVTFQNFGCGNPPFFLCSLFPGCKCVWNFENRSAEKYNFEFMSLHPPSFDSLRWNGAQFGSWGKNWQKYESIKYEQIQRNMK